MSRYPHVPIGQLQPDDNINTMLSNMDAGRCTAAIAMADAWDNAARAAEGRQCNKVQVDTLFSEANGMPVAARFAEAISFLVAEYKATGRYTVLTEEYLFRPILEKTTSIILLQNSTLIFSGAGTKASTYHLLHPVGRMTL